MALNPGRVGEGVQLVDPTGGGGGGGAGDVARPVSAPDYAGMYSRAMTAALEPAKFMWGKYKDQEEINKQQQELLLRGRELTETQRANQIRESQAEADQEIRRLQQQETSRHDQAEETRLSSAEQETERKNRADEDRENAKDEWQKSYYGALTDEAKNKADESRSALDDIKNDQQVLSTLRDKLKAFGPTDHYNMQDHPELAEIIQDATGNMRTTNGRQQLEQLVGHNTALGQELERRNEMTTWTPAAHDAFIASYNRYNQGPEGAHVSNQERFNNAFQAGSQTESLEKEKSSWGDAGNKAYIDFMNSKAAFGMTPQEAERAAIEKGRTANEEFQASLKQKTAAQTKPNVAMKPEDIGALVDDSIKQGKDEAADDFAKRKAQVKNEAIVAEDANPGGAATVVQKYAGQAPGAITTTTAPAQKSAADQWAARFGNKPQPNVDRTSSIQNPEMGPGSFIDTSTLPKPTPTPTPKVITQPAILSKTPGGMPEGNQGAQNTTLLSPWDYWKNLFGTSEEVT